MQFGAIIIGDEILSGKRQDKHLARAVALLGARGLEIAWAQYLGDDPDLIAATLQRTLAGTDVVFSFGGIGATPDDHTRQSAAMAAGVALKLHADAEAEIRGRFSDDPKGVTPQRLRMGEFPEGAVIIPNPFNRIPGFSFRRSPFPAGFSGNGVADAGVGARQPLPACDCRARDRGGDHRARSRRKPADRPDE